MQGSAYVWRATCGKRCSLFTMILANQTRLLGWTASTFAFWAVSEIPCMNSYITLSGFAFQTHSIELLAYLCSISTMLLTTIALLIHLNFLKIKISSLLLVFKNKVFVILADVLFQMSWEIRLVVGWKYSSRVSLFSIGRLGFNEAKDRKKLGLEQ